MVYCDACEDLKTNHPNFVANGLTDTECTSLKNDTGFTPSVGHTDCEDLGNANDCLIGNMQEEIKDKEVCDWKDFTSSLVGNIHAVLSGIICAICGIWINIHNLWNKVNQHDCYIENLYKETSFDFTEDMFTKGTGISFDSRKGDEHYVDVGMVVKGNIYRIIGSIEIDLTDSHWGSIGKASVGGMNTDDGNWTICILKIKKSDYPAFKGIYGTVGQFTNNGCGQITVSGYNGDATNKDDRKYPSQWGYSTSDPSVPEGYYYIRVSLSNGITWKGNSSSIKVTFCATGIANIDNTKIEC